MLERCACPDACRCKERVQVEFVELALLLLEPPKRAARVWPALAAAGFFAASALAFATAAIIAPPAQTPPGPADVRGPI